MRATRYPLVTSPYLAYDENILSFSANGAGGGAAWPTANLAIYLPVMFPEDRVVNGVKFHCSSGNSAGRNFDAGFFDASNVKLSSAGATLVAAGVNTWAANQTLEGGKRYLFGLSVNNTGVVIFRAAPLVISLRLNGYAQEASAEPLPSTATPAQTTNAYLPYVVFTFANLP